MSIPSTAAISATFSSPCNDSIDGQITILSFAQGAYSTLQPALAEAPTNTQRIAPIDHPIEMRGFLRIGRGLSAIPPQFIGLDFAEGHQAVVFFVNYPHASVLDCEFEHSHTLVVHELR